MTTFSDTTAPLPPPSDTRRHSFRQVCRTPPFGEAPLLSFALTLLLAMALTGCSDDAADQRGGDSSFSGDYAEEQAPYASTQTSAQRPAGAGTGQRVTIVDHGFRMPRGVQVIPSDWQLTQNIATDPNSGQIAQYHLEMRGPGGELITALGTATYGPMLGTSFEQTLRQLATRGLGSELSDLSIGTLQQSALLENTPEFQKAVALVRQRGLQVNGLEAPLSGSRNGKAVRGVVYVGHFTSAAVPGAGTIHASAVVSPPERLEHTIRINERIAHSYRANPEFEQRIMQVSAAAMQRQNAAHRQRMATSRAQHQQRMANSQARFQAHQRMMQDRYAASDQQHQQWMNDFRSSGTSAWSGNDYTGQDAYIDGIHERSTFQDPYSGQQVSRDGQYDSWYTNGQGDYYGTDDPSFDPYGMDGDWQQIDPLRPNP